MRVLGRLQWLFSALAVFMLLAAVVSGVDDAFPPPLVAGETSPEILDRNGALLFVQATEQGRWRLSARASEVDQQFLDMLLAYEDKRFYQHGGVDPVAMMRAFWQMARHGRIVSGGSTITMQVARLLEPRNERSLSVKLRQMLRAVQIEARLSKQDILGLYLTLAPYGGNLEGIRAASLAWFGKEPAKLRLSEAALLVALPQSPETRRPDRFPETAKKARDRVLIRMADADLIARSEIERASGFAVPAGRRTMPHLSPHLSLRMIRNGVQGRRLTLDKEIQTRLEQVVRDAAQQLPSGVSVAMVLAEAQSGDVLARVGSVGWHDEERAGWIDMVDQPRSPGSALKPFIYSLAFEQGLIAPETIISDRPANFFGYRPANFDMAYRGDVTIREALQLSLNVPAVRLLEAVGPLRLVHRLKQGGAELSLPLDGTPGLAIGLGGAGVTLSGLTQAYTAFPSSGRVTQLRYVVDPGARPEKRILLQPSASWQVAQILKGVVPPVRSANLGLAYKTGTSYGYRDAWSIGFDGKHVLGVWVGRADNAAVPGITGAGTAAPLLFEAWAHAGLPVLPLSGRPNGMDDIVSNNALPERLRRFASEGPAARSLAPEPEPVIVYPRSGVRMDLISDGVVQPLVIKLQGGRAPFRWLANGVPLDGATRRRSRQWLPDGQGQQKLTVIDAVGRASSVELYVD